MCVGLSAKVISVKDGVAMVDCTGAKREISAELLDDLEPGDYVMVHAGCAIAKITDDDKSETQSAHRFLPRSVRITRRSLMSSLKKHHLSRRIRSYLA